MRSCAGVLHRLFLRVAVAHHHHRAIVRVQSLGQPGALLSAGMIWLACAWSAVTITGITVFSREFQRLLHRFVKINRFADLAARIGRMVLLIDGRAFDLQEETFHCDSAGQSLSPSSAPASAPRRHASGLAYRSPAAYRYYRDKTPSALPSVPAYCHRQRVPAAVYPDWLPSRRQEAASVTIW